jgi:hypothetical protein
MSCISASVDCLHPFCSVVPISEWLTIRPERLLNTVCVSQDDVATPASTRGAGRQY